MYNESFVNGDDVQARVTCSCGRTNTLRMKDNKYRAIITSNWLFQKGIGWTCGRANHTQHSTRLVPIPRGIES